jgi:gliding motility-associated-like protein
MKIIRDTIFFLFLWCVYFIPNFSFSQNIIDTCFQSSTPSTQFVSSANLYNTASSDLLQWTGATWIGGWPGALLTIPPPLNSIGCRAIFIGSGTLWTTGGEAFGLRLNAPLISGTNYSFDFTYVSHGLGSNGAFSPKIFTNTNGTIGGAYDTGNLQPVGNNWETHTFSFIANAAQAGHTWIIINTTPIGSSGLINSFCQNCNTTTQSCGVSVNSQSICQGSTANVIATAAVSGTYNYVWTVPTGFTNPGNVSNFSTTVAGNYSVVITNTVTGCVSPNASGSVIINAAPVVSVNSQSICQGSTANVIATPAVSGTYNYVWTVPTGFTNPGNVSNFSTTVAGNYTVVITNTVTGCVSPNASGSVIVNAAPVVSVNSQSICQGSTANVIATPAVSGTYNYVWTVPTGFTNPGNVSNFSTTVAGNYSVVITDNVTGCSSIVISGVIDYYPDFDFTINEGCINNKYIIEIATLSTTFDVDTATYNWQNEDLVSIGNDFTLDITSYLNSTSIIEQLPLIITVTITNLNGCQKTSQIIIDKVYCGIQKGISPNNDNLNDFFDLTLLNVRQLKIYNRFGTNVYSHDNYKNEWYGQTDSGSELVDGVYYYLIDFNTPVESKTGWIYINRQH